MTKKLWLTELADFDPSKYLDSDEAVAQYIGLAIEEGDPGLLAAALGDVARARGMSNVAEAAGLTREALYKALRPQAHPRFDTIQRVCKALGVRLTVAPWRRPPKQQPAGRSHLLQWRGQCTGQQPRRCPDIWRGRTR